MPITDIFLSPKESIFTPTLLRDVMISGSNDDHVSYLQAPEKYSWFHIKGSWSGRKGGYKGGGAPSHPLPWDYEAINVPNLINRMYPFFRSFEGKAILIESIISTYKVSHKKCPLAIF